jgi:hypothetical protein
VDEYYSKTAPPNGVVPRDARGVRAPGFNNVSAFMIRFLRPPKPYEETESEEEGDENGEDELTKELTNPDDPEKT